MHKSRIMRFVAMILTFVLTLAMFVAPVAANDNAFITITSVSVSNNVFLDFERYQSLVDKGETTVTLSVRINFNVTLPDKNPREETVALIKNTITTRIEDISFSLALDGVIIDSDSGTFSGGSVYEHSGTRSYRYETTIQLPLPTMEEFTKLIEEVEIEPGIPVSINLPYNVSVASIDYKVYTNTVSVPVAVNDWWIPRLEGTDKIGVLIIGNTLFSQSSYGNYNELHYRYYMYVDPAAVESGIISPPTVNSWAIASSNNLVARVDSWELLDKPITLPDGTVVNAYLNLYFNSNTGNNGNTSIKINAPFINHISLAPPQYSTMHDKVSGEMLASASDEIPQYPDEIEVVKQTYKEEYEKPVVIIITENPPAKPVIPIKKVGLDFLPVDKGEDNKNLVDGEMLKLVKNGRFQAALTLRQLDLEAIEAIEALEEGEETISIELTLDGFRNADSLPLDFKIVRILERNSWASIKQNDDKTIVIDVRKLSDISSSDDARSITIIIDVLHEELNIGDIAAVFIGDIEIMYEGVEIEPEILEVEEGIEPPENFDWTDALLGGEDILNLIIVSDPKLQ